VVSENEREILKENKKRNALSLVPQSGAPDQLRSASDGTSSSDVWVGTLRCGCVAQMRLCALLLPSSQDPSAAFWS
jgi:hypothetical protein